MELDLDVVNDALSVGAILVLADDADEQHLSVLYRTWVLAVNFLAGGRMSRPVAVLTSEVRIAGQLEPCVALILGSVSVIERMEPDYAVVDFNRAFRARSWKTPWESRPRAVVAIRVFIVTREPTAAGVAESTAVGDEISDLVPWMQCSV